MQDLCRTQAEEIIIGTLIVRQLITSGRYSEVSDTTINILTKMGYDPWNPTAISLWTPKSLDDVRHIDKSLRAASPTDEEVAPLITSLLSFAGYVFNASGRADTKRPTIYVTDPGRRRQVYILAISLVASALKIYEGTPYLLSCYALTISNIGIKEALNAIAKRLALGRLSSPLSAATLGCMGAQVYVRENNI